MAPRLTALTSKAQELNRNTFPRIRRLVVRHYNGKGELIAESRFNRLSTAIPTIYRRILSGNAKVLDTFTIKHADFEFNIADITVWDVSIELDWSTDLMKKTHKPRTKDTK